MPPRKTPRLEMTDEPGVFTDTLATWERHLEAVKKLPDNTMNKQALIANAEAVIAAKKRKGS